LYTKFFKRIVAFILSLTGFVFFLPIFLSIALILTIVNKGKPFFVQERPGKDEKIFKLIKFKTMNDKRGIDGKLLPDNDRLTSIGNWIRKLSLDETAQLINVIKGDMSLIGPRPLLVEYLSLYDSEQKRRHKIRPGITGWAQVNGRNAISWQQKFEYDVWYVDNLSFKLDIKIFFLTIKKILFREGINASADITMEKFKGND